MLSAGGSGRRVVAAAFAVLSLVGSGCLLGGCGFSNLAFTTDNRLHFVAPEARALVKLPLTIRWRMTGFEVVKPAEATLAVTNSVQRGYFAVFIDRAPVKPGQSLDAVADRSCRRTPGCVNAGYLANLGVYTTSVDSITIRQVNSNTYQDVQTHEATVVLLDPGGRRIGESAWYVDFRMKKPG